MNKIFTLFPHQELALQETNGFDSCGYFLDMGLGKTFVGSEKMKLLNCQFNLLVCQHSKIDDWMEHFNTYYSNYCIYNLTVPKQMKAFFEHYESSEQNSSVIGVINYELIFRRNQMLDLKNFTMILDESSMIANENAKRSKFIHKMQPNHVILLSGTPTGGKYEKIWSQLSLIGWKISKKMFYNQYIIQEWIDDDSGFKKAIIVGYKNTERLKKKLRQYGCVFMKTEEVFDLPDKVDVPISINSSLEYFFFMKNDYVRLKNGIELIGDSRLAKRLYARQLCGHYNSDKLSAFKDLIQSTDDRMIVFYNFDDELFLLEKIILEENKPISYVNGKRKDLTAYEQNNNSITLVQYQAGARGHNFQKANKIIYFTLPESAELFEQSKKRTHRIGQNNTCFYYYLLCKNSIEFSILDTLNMRRNYDDYLFQKEG